MTREKKNNSCPLLHGSGSTCSKGRMQPWDSFLDFSRLMEPKVGWKIPILKRRLEVNGHTFGLNYIISAFLGMVFLGFLLFNKRVVLASLLVAVVCHLSLLIPAVAPDLALPTSTERAIMIFALSNASFYWLGVWRLGTVLAISVGLLSLGHAIGRPVPGELEVYYNNSEETETVEFDAFGGTDHVNGLHRRRPPHPMAIPGTCTAVKMTSLEPSASSYRYYRYRSAKAD